MYTHNICTHIRTQIMCTSVQTVHIMCVCTVEYSVLNCMIYTHTHIYMIYNTYTHTYIYVYIHTHNYTYTHTLLYTHLYKYLFTLTHCHIFFKMKTKFFLTVLESRNILQFHLGLLFSLEIFFKRQSFVFASK